MTRKPNGYWTLENRIEETKNLVKKLSKDPQQITYKDFAENGFRQLMKQVGDSPYKALIEAGYSVKQKLNKRKIQIPPKEKVLAAYQELKTHKRVAEIFDISYPTLFRWLEKLNIREELRFHSFYHPRVPHFTKKGQKIDSSISKEEWLNYGKENKYDKLSSRNKLKEIARVYYEIGKKTGWINKLLPVSTTKKKLDGFYSKMNKEEWLNYGKERNYDKLTRTELWKKEFGYYKKGSKNGWIKDIIPSFAEMNKEEWLRYGKERNYDQLSHTELQAEKRGYYDKGQKEKWLNEIILLKQKPKGFYSDMTKEQWIDYGREKEYDKLSRIELSRQEGRYYQIGASEGWISELIPKLNRIKQNSLEQQLIAYGGK